MTFKSKIIFILIAWIAITLILTFAVNELSDSAILQPYFEEKHFTPVGFFFKALPFTGLASGGLILAGWLDSNK